MVNVERLLKKKYTEGKWKSTSNNLCRSVVFTENEENN